MSVDTALTSRTRRRWDAKSRRYDWFTWLEERLGGSRLRRLWSLVGQGRLLEVGVGTGANLKYHPLGAQLTGIDLSPGMLGRARARAACLGKDTTLLEMDAQALEFADADFDQVVATFVFCSVPDPVQGLREAGRVLKPEGKLLLLEHVRGPGLLGKIMDWLNPLAVLLSGGNINRDTVENVKRAGLVVEEVHSYLWGLVKLIVARPQSAERKEPG